jgi:hypothetical protein
VCVLSDGRDEAGIITARLDEAGSRLQDRPAEVRAWGDPIDLFPGDETHVAYPELAGAPIEGESPGVAQPEREDLRTARLAAEGVVRRNGVGVGPVDVDSQDLSQKVVAALGVWAPGDREEKGLISGNPNAKDLVTRGPSLMSMTGEVDKLVECARKGDRGAFEELVSAVTCR